MLLEYVLIFVVDIYGPNAQIQLYMPAYHHLFSYTLPFVNGGAHYCMCNGIVLTY